MKLVNDFSGEESPSAILLKRHWVSVLFTMVAFYSIGQVLGFFWGPMVGARTGWFSAWLIDAVRAADGEGSFYASPLSDVVFRFGFREVMIYASHFIFDFLAAAMAAGWAVLCFRGMTAEDMTLRFQRMMRWYLNIAFCFFVASILLIDIDAVFAATKDPVVHSVFVLFMWGCVPFLARRNGGIFDSWSERLFLLKGKE